MTNGKTEFRPEAIAYTHLEEALLDEHDPSLTQRDVQMIFTFSHPTVS